MAHSHCSALTAPTLLMIDPAVFRRLIGDWFRFPQTLHAYMKSLSEQQTYLHRYIRTDAQAVTHMHTQMETPHACMDTHTHTHARTHTHI